MKKILLLFISILCFTFVSCSTDDYLDYSNHDGIINLVKAPNVIAYSGDVVLGSTFVTRSNAGNGDLNNKVWKDFNADDLTSITDEERQAVLNAIKEKVTDKRISEDVVFPWENYFLQDVISGQNGSWEGAGSNGTSSSSYVFEAYNKGAECSQKYWPRYDYENYEEVTNSAHLNNYFQKQNADGSQTKINETTLMTGMKYGTYEEMKGKQFRWYINCHENLHWYEYIVVQVDGSYYICFDFGCGYPENDVDDNPGRGAEHNDWDYNDWILKITPAGPHDDVWTGEEPKTDEVCDKCDHPKHGETCDQCTEDDPCYQGDDIQQVPDNDIELKKNEVEVNLHADEKEGYHESHLSIHVRYATDVEIFIPVPKKYYLEKDDMEIAMKHEDNHMIHGGPNELTYKLKDSDLEVTLNIEYLDDGIHIWTDGITQEVIDWCAEKCHGDGITFEIWNYFNNEIDLDDLKYYLDRATIKFLDSEPDYYVNAFADEDGQKQENDCTVSIVDEQRATFEDEPEEGHWKNGSSYNQIYEKR